MKAKLLLSSILILLIANSFKIENPADQNLNISFLLDLSDRIDPKTKHNPAMEYYQRDIQYIKSIQKAFIEHIKKKKILRLNDQMQVFFDPEPKNPEINKLSQQLKVSFNKHSNKADIEKIEKIFSEVPARIYQSAIKDNKFVGSDIWGFFKENVNDYCIKQNSRNILFILTDGYMFHEDSKFMEGSKSSYLTSKLIKTFKLNTSNYKLLMQKKGYGYIKANQDLNNLEVVVLGVNPVKGNPFESDVINKYWIDWFKEMKVKNYIIKKADLPSDLDPIIQKYINP